MGLREEFEQVAVDIFDAFENVVVEGKYIQREVTYVAGGSTTHVDTEYRVRLIRDTKDSSTTADLDVDSEMAVFLTPASELSIVAGTKDLIEFQGKMFTVLSIDPQDPADALLTINCRSR